MDDNRWLQLVEECVELLDEFDRHKADFDSRQQELADHAISRLQEILERSGVEVIAAEPVFDRNRHQPEKHIAKIKDGHAIAQTISPGFAIERRVLRRARVRLAESQS